MAYRNRFGITKIRNQTYDNLGISWDQDQPHTPRYPVMLFTWNMNNKNDHHHVMLNRSQAKRLKDWLDAYLKDPKAKRTKRRKARGSSRE